MPTPSVHTRITLSSFPIDAAIPAAKPSASLMIATGASIPASRSAAASISASRAPFSCGRLGASSTTPLRTRPGTPTPTAAISRALPAAASTCAAIVSTIPSAGSSTSAYSSSLASGNEHSFPGSWWSTTSPATTRSDNVTPTVFAIATPLIELAYPVQPVERRDFIAFRQGGIVEHRIHEVLQLSAQRHHRLANVQQLAGAFADDMHAQDRMRLAMEDQLQPARRIAAYLAACNLAIVGHAHLVRHILFGQLLLGLRSERRVGKECRSRWSPYH